MSKYNFSRLDESNFPDFVQLMSTVYGAVDIDSLKAKYDTSALGANNVGYLAYAAGDSVAAAYYGVFPLKIAFPDSIILAAQSGDTMTHPDHRGKGLFVELAKRTYVLAQQEGIQFIFGFPNANSYPGFVRKLGWTHAFDMVSVNILTPTLPLKYITGKFHSLAKLHRLLFYKLLTLAFETASSCPDNPSSVAQSGGTGVLRDAAFLEYKKNSGMVLKTGNAYFFVKSDGDVCIGDVVDYGDGSDTKCGLIKLRLVGALLGMPRIKTFSSPDGALGKALSGYGIQRGSLPYGFVDFSSGRDLSKIHFTYIDYDTF